MTSTLNKLTAATVAAATFKGTPRKLFDGGGLYLLINQSGRYWRLKYRIRGREKSLSFGVYPAVTLKEARQKRDEAKTLLRNGTDPSLARHRAKNAPTFEEIAREWLERKRTQLAPNTVTLSSRRLERWVFPYIGKEPLDSLEPPTVLQVLRRIESAGRNETARRMRQRISEIYRYAIAIGKATRDPAADLKGTVSAPNSKSRAAITDPRKLGPLMRAIEAYSGQPATRAALHLLALTFVRPGELRKAEWSEFDLENAIWRIPAPRTKMKREHTVPLSKQAIAILTELHPITGHRTYVFESTRPGRPLSENTLNVALRTLGYTGDQMTAHGFRATASTLLHELNWQPEVIELQLAHQQRNKVAAVYNRSQRLQDRRKMMQCWSDYLETLRAGTSNVAPIGSSTAMPPIRSLGV